ncbi:MAG: cell division protein SepF [Christensenellales bacterium]
MCAQQADTMRICRPQDYDEAAEVLDALQKGQMVTLDLSQMARDVANRLLDFVCGGVYFAGGSIQRMASYTYLITPAGVQTVGDVDAPDEQA